MENKIEMGYVLCGFYERECITRFLKLHFIFILLAFPVTMTLCCQDLSASEATYYGDELVGRKTASGHRFNQQWMTCAVKHYPFGTTLRVTYGGKSVFVVVTDRPDDKTDIDLTKRAFKKLAPLKEGRLRGVKIERIRN